MNKNLLVNLTLMLFAALLIFGCQKSITEIPEGRIKKELAATGKSEPKKNECQLTFGYDGGGYPNWFHYNKSGLADQWQVDLGGLKLDIAIGYDSKNRMSAASFLDNGNLIRIEFVWMDDRITREHWDVGGFFLFDMINTYDQHDRIVKRETSYGFSAKTQFTPEGNHLRDVVYFGDEALASDDYTYNEPNKNPFTSIPGVPYAFLYINPYQSKWYATSDNFTVYDNGQSLVLLDTDPAQTQMQMGFQHYLSNVRYFDKVSNTFMIRNFEYQNCGPQDQVVKENAGASSPVRISTDKNLYKHGPFFISSPDKMKKQIKNLREQHAY